MQDNLNTPAALLQQPVCVHKHATSRHLAVAQVLFICRVCRAHGDNVQPCVQTDLAPAACGRTAPTGWAAGPWAPAAGRRRPAPTLPSSVAGPASEAAAAARCLSPACDHEHSSKRHTLQLHYCSQIMLLAWPTPYFMRVGTAWGKQMS